MTDHSTLPQGPENIVVTGPARSGKSTVARGLLIQLRSMDHPVSLCGEFAVTSDLDPNGAPRIVIWDMPNVPHAVHRDPRTRYIGCTPLLG